MTMNGPADQIRNTIAMTIHARAVLEPVAPGAGDGRDANDDWRQTDPRRLLDHVDAQLIEEVADPVPYSGCIGLPVTSVSRSIPRGALRHKYRCETRLPRPRRGPLQ